MRKNYRLVVKLLPLSFLLVLGMPFINGYLHLFPVMENTENRKLADKPIFDYTQLDLFPDEYTKYYNDNLSLRNQYLFLYNFYNYFLLNKSIAEDKVIIGKDGWLFRYNNLLPKLAINESLDNNSLSNFKNEIDNRTKYYQSKGIDYYLFIIPNKASVYDEYVSSRYQTKDEQKYENKVEKLMNYLALDSVSNVHYLKDLMQEKKKINQVYYKKDHHWNEWGAYYGTEYMIDIISKKHPNIGNIPELEDYQINEEKEHYGNLIHVLGLQQVTYEDRISFIPKEGVKIYGDGKKRKYKSPKGFAYPWAYQKSTAVNNISLPKALVIRDSFSNSVIPFFGNSFRDVLYIWDAWHYGWNKQIVQDEQPDVVINIMVESYIYRLVENSDIEY